EFTGRLTTNSAAFGGSATSTFTSGGFLGIGTSSPFANLSVHNLASSTQTTLFAIGSTTNVGAGTYATSTLFTVSNIGTVGINNTNGTAGVTLSSDSNSVLTVNTAAAARARIFAASIEIQSGGSGTFNSSGLSLFNTQPVFWSS